MFSILSSILFDLLKKKNFVGRKRCWIHHDYQTEKGSTLSDSVVTAVWIEVKRAITSSACSRFKQKMCSEIVVLMWNAICPFFASADLEMARISTNGIMAEKTFFS